MPSPERHTSRRRLLAAAIVIALVSLTAAVVTVGSHERVCIRCHDVSAVGRASTGHATTGCYACHLDAGAWSLPAFKLRELFSMYPKAIMGSDGPEDALRTSAAACTPCHQEIMESQTPQVSGGFRILHRSCAVGVPTCDGCHPLSGHGLKSRVARSSTMSECIRCHEDENVPIECETCHVGGREQAELVSGPLRLTHGEKQGKLHGMGEIGQCSTCHDSDHCVRCHGVAVPHTVSFGRQHGELSREPRAACLTCHRQSFCDSCHGLAMPHPAGFLRRHSDVASGTEDQGCIKCHTTEDCERCHARHVHGGSARGVPIPEPIPPGRGRGGGS